MHTASSDHGDRDLADHPATAVDVKEGRNFGSEEINEDGGVPGVPTAGGNIIIDRNLAPNFNENENGDPGGGRESTGGAGLTGCTMEWGSLRAEPGN